MPLYGLQLIPDASGQSVAGSQGRLDKAFDSGGDFKVQVDGEVLFTCTRVVRTTSGIYHCSYETLNLVGNDPLISYGNRSTDGLSIIYRTSLFGGADRGSSTVNSGAKWFVKVR